MLLERLIEIDEVTVAEEDCAGVEDAICESIERDNVDCAGSEDGVCPTDAVPLVSITFCESEDLTKIVVEDRTSAKLIEDVSTRRLVRA